MLLDTHMQPAPVGLEEPFRFFFVYAASRILHFDHQAGFIFSGLYRYAASSRGELKGVIEQFEHHLSQAVLISLDDRQGAGQFGAQ